MMGSGKTTIGRILSKKLGLNFVDTDILIEKECGLGIKEIFEKYGEKYFRNKEKKVILKILKNKNSCVIASGGGAFLNINLQKIILKKTISIWLDANVELIYKRCRNSNERPLLLKNKKKNLKNLITDILKIRKPIYRKANFTVKTNQNPSIVCGRITKYIKDLI